MCSLRSRAPTERFARGDDPRDVVNQAPYHDRCYDPVWALCQELNLPVVTHSGPADKDSYDEHLGIYVSRSCGGRRADVVHVWSGVFERFPR